MVRQHMGKIYRFRQGWLVHYQSEWYSPGRHDHDMHACLYPALLTAMYLFTAITSFITCSANHVYSGYASAGIPVWISWLKYLSFVFYGYSQLVHIEFKDRQLYSCTDPNAAAGMCRHMITCHAAQTVCKLVIVQSCMCTLVIVQFCIEGAPVMLMLMPVVLELCVP